MQWERRLSDLFEDLEQQAAGLHLAERDAELADRSQAEYAHVMFASRMHASVGRPASLDVLGVGALPGTIAGAGVDWCLLRSSEGSREWVVRLAAVKAARGLSQRALSEQARPVVAALSFRSALRGVAESRDPAVVHHLDGSQTSGVLGRVGSDFVEMVDVGDEAGRGRSAPAVDVLRLASIGAVRRG